MTRKSNLRLMKDKLNSTVDRQTIADAEAAFKPQNLDNSPVFDQISFRNVLEQTTALNLGNVAHEMTACCKEFPLLIERKPVGDYSMDHEGYLMAAAWEAGRRYAILFIFQLIADETEALTDEPEPTHTGVLLEQ